MLISSWCYEMVIVGEWVVIGVEEVCMEGCGLVGVGVEVVEVVVRGCIGCWCICLLGYSRSRSWSSLLSSFDEEGICCCYYYYYGVEGVWIVVSNEGEVYCFNFNMKNLVS